MRTCRRLCNHQMSVRKDVPFLRVLLKYESLLLAQDNKDVLV